MSDFSLFKAFTAFDESHFRQLIIPANAIAPEFNEKECLPMKNDRQGKMRHDPQLRAKAEAKLAGSVQVDENLSLQRYDELLHELRIHQIELEMQNEELRRAHIALEASRAHYVELYDFAPVGYLTLTAEGIIAEINLSGANLLGMERKYLVNRRFARFIADEDKDRWYRFSLLTMQQGGKQSCELLLHRPDGALFHAQLDCLCTEADHAPPMLRIVLTDITERKQSEEAQRVAAAAFETQEGIVVADANRVILRVNQAFSRITGYSAEDVIGKEPAILHSERHDEDFYEALWRTIEAERYWQGEVWMKRKNGEVFPVRLSLTAVTCPEGCITHYVGTITDITLQKQAEKVLLDSRKRLENQVVSTKEELEKFRDETAEVNAALNVMLKHRALDKSEAQIMFSREFETTVLPLLKKLKGASAGRFQSIRLIDIIETNLQDLVKSYGRSANLAVVYHKLTPVEKQVASLVRQGLPTKIIAATLNISPGTVSSHRKHIRKKLGLDGTDINLYGYLASLTESDKSPDA